MDSIGKSFSLLLVVILAVSSLMIVKPSFAQSIPKPSVPEFTIKYVDNSYDVPPIYGIDQYTGKNITVKEGYHVDNRTIDFTIKNQPFTPYADSSGNYIGLYYNFRSKGHYGDEWTYYPFSPDGQTTGTYDQFFNIISGPFVNPFKYYNASNSIFTVISINLNVFTGTGRIASSQPFSNGGQVDFQVQSQIGYIFKIPGGTSGGSYYNFTGESSDWSNTQTITLGEASTSTTSPNSTTTPTLTPTLTPTTAPTSTPSVPEFSWLAILPLFVGMLFIMVKLRHRKTAKINQ